MRVEPPLPDIPAVYGPAQPLPEWLAAGVERVLRDLQRPRPLALRLGWTPPGAASLYAMWSREARRPLSVADPFHHLWVQEPGDDRLTGLSVDEGSPAEVALALADELQVVFAESSVTWGGVRPACPGHPHPAEADWHAGDAWWRCPQTRAWLWRVGEAPDP